MFLILKKITKKKIWEKENFFFQIVFLKKNFLYCEKNLEKKCQVPKCYFSKRNRKINEEENFSRKQLLKKKIWIYWNFILNAKSGRKRPAMTSRHHFIFFFLFKIYILHAHWHWLAMTSGHQWSAMTSLPFHFWHFTLSVSF